MSTLDYKSAQRPDPDALLVAIAEYAKSFQIQSNQAYETARYCFMDTLACGFQALKYPACTRLLGPIVPGALMPGGARVPGTSFELEPVQAAFNIGAMVRWLDFNDTWLAAEWGHPSDNLGGILAVADYMARKAVMEGRKPPVVRDVLTAMIKAHEIQGVIAIAKSVAPAIARVEVKGGGDDKVASAILVRTDGYLATNAHVVAQAKSVQVVLSDGTVLTAQVVGTDPMTDVAILKIERDQLPVAVLGTATDLESGEPAISIGSPLGPAGGPSVTVGVISGLGRRVKSSDGTDLRAGSYNPLHTLKPTSWTPVGPWPRRLPPRGPGPGRRRPCSTSTPWSTCDAAAGSAPRPRSSGVRCRSSRCSGSTTAGSSTSTACGRRLAR